MNITNLSGEEDKEIHEEEKHELNLSLQEEGLFKEKEDKRNTRSSKRNFVCQNLEKQSIISNEENNKILYSNQKIFNNLEKENLKLSNNKDNCNNNKSNSNKNNKSFEDFVKTIDSCNATNVFKYGFCDNFQMTKKLTHSEEDIESHKKIGMQVEEIQQDYKNALNLKSSELLRKQLETDKKNSENAYDSSDSSYLIGAEQKVKDEKTNISSDPNLVSSKAFFFNEFGIQNTQREATANNDNKNLNEVAATKIVVINNLNSNILQSNGNSGNISNPRALGGISSLKNKLSLKVVIPVVDKKILIDANTTQTMSVKENKENLRSLHNIRESV